MPRSSDPAPLRTRLSPPLPPNVTTDARGQTTTQDWDVSEIASSFRHGFWAARRQRVYESLVRCHVPRGRIQSFAECGRGAHVERETTTGAVRVRCHRCHDRFCQACAQERTAILMRSIGEQVPKAKCLHVVLTIASSDAPLRDQLTRLYACASHLRRRPFWKQNAAGGVQCLELTRNEATGQWHPHLHCLVHSDWLDQSKLADEWEHVTGDSRVVHVSLVQNTAAAVREVTKYVSKPLHRSVDFDASAIDALILGLHGRRMVTTFGSWRGIELMPPFVEPDGLEWVYVCTLEELHYRAAAGDAWSRAALAYLYGQKPGRTRTAPPKMPAGP